MTPSRNLAERISGGELISAPGAPDPLTARMVEQAGFPAVYMTGFGATASRLGMPDLGLLGLSEMAEMARNMVRAVDVPVIADADAGYGGPLNIARTVEEYLQAGVAALHLEDQVQPKRCGQLAGIQLVDIDAAARRLEAAMAARGDADLLIIGRTDALPAEGLDAAVERATRYHDCGVDLVFVDGIKTVAEVEAVARRVPGRKVVSIVDGNDTTALSAADLADMGFAVAIYAVTTLFAATHAIRAALGHLATAGTPAGGPAHVSYAEYADIVGLAANQAFAEDFDS